MNQISAKALLWHMGVFRLCSKKSRTGHPGGRAGPALSLGGPQRDSRPHGKQGVPEGEWDPRSHPDGQRRDYILQARGPGWTCPCHWLRCHPHVPCQG